MANGDGILDRREEPREEELEDSFQLYAAPLQASRKGNEMLEFHGGSFRCAIKSKCTVIPMALIDSFRVLDEKGSKPVTVQLHYLKPIEYEEYKDLKTTQLAELVRSRIAACIAENS